MKQSRNVLIFYFKFRTTRFTPVLVVYVVEEFVLQNNKLLNFWVKITLPMLSVRKESTS